jgi:hypothetical protein
VAWRLWHRALPALAFFVHLNLGHLLVSRVLLGIFALVESPYHKVARQHLEATVQLDLVQPTEFLAIKVFTVQAAPWTSSTALHHRVTTALLDLRRLLEFHLRLDSFLVEVIGCQ